MSFAELADQYHIKYDNAKEDAFIINEWNNKQSGNEVKFQQNYKANLYNFKFSDKYLNRAKHNDLQLIETIAENRKNYTTEQYE